MKSIKQRAAWKWMLGGMLIILAVAGVGYRLWQNRQAELKTSQTLYETEPVRRSDLSLTVSGTGKLQAGKILDLGFSFATTEDSDDDDADTESNSTATSSTANNSGEMVDPMLAFISGVTTSTESSANTESSSNSGTVKTVYVQVGDQVTEGQMLAELDNLDELKVLVETRTLELEEIQQSLDDLLASGSKSALAQAELDVATAQANFIEAKKNVLSSGAGRCEKTTTETYFAKYLDLYNQVHAWELAYNDGNSGYGEMYYQETVAPLIKERNKAYTNWKYCEGYTEQEIAASRANLTVAEKTLKQAEEVLQKMKDNGGVDPDEQALAEAEVKNAEMQLSMAKANLDGATLVAPAAGKVTYIAAQAGESVGTGVFITLEDLDNPVVEVSLDEVDLTGVSTSCIPEITFDAIPGRTFTGTFTAIGPQLIETTGTSVVQGWITLKGAKTAGGKTLYNGQNAAVDLNCAEVKNALIVPVEALHTGSEGSHTVRVLTDAGEVEERPVEVGLETYTFAEIRNGLKEGEEVIISQAGSK